MNNPIQIPDRKASEFANEGEIAEQDLVNLESISGHEDNRGADSGVLGKDDIRQPIGAIPKSALTGRHDDGSSANETEDGLSDSEELTRHLAEDLPTGVAGWDEDDIPVFERGRTRTGI